MLSDETLHEQIIDFYDAGVESYYADRVIEFHKEKKRNFAWLFGDEDRIWITITDDESVDFFLPIILIFRISTTKLLSS